MQYFAAVEPQRRLAPHVHVAIRGTLSRVELRQVLAATYHQVWWPPADEIRFGDGELPVGVVKWFGPAGRREFWPRVAGCSGWWGFLACLAPAFGAGGA